MVITHPVHSLPLRIYAVALNDSLIKTPFGIRFSQELADCVVEPDLLYKNHHHREKKHSNWDCHKSGVWPKTNLVNYRNGSLRFAAKSCSSTGDLPKRRLPSRLLQNRPLTAIRLSAIQFKRLIKQHTQQTIVVHLMCLSETINQLEDERQYYIYSRTQNVGSRMKKEEEKRDCAVPTHCLLIIYEVKKHNSMRCDDILLLYMVEPNTPMQKKNRKKSNHRNRMWEPSSSVYAVRVAVAPSTQCPIYFILFRCCYVLTATDVDNDMPMELPCTSKPANQQPAQLDWSILILPNTAID